MQNIETKIMINAAVEEVWATLTKFEAYTEWNPFIHSEGKAVEGTRLKNTMHLEGQKPQVFTPKLLEVKENAVLRWEGNLFFKGLFDGEHYFKLKAINANQTELIHGENFRGILVGPIMRMIKDATQKGFETMNQALKKRAENSILKE
jgi:hypothetical protein